MTPDHVGDATGKVVHTVDTPVERDNLSPANREESKKDNVSLLDSTLRFTPGESDARLAAALEQAAARRDRRRNEREQFVERRNHGLTARHNRKLARLRNAAQDPTVAVTATHPQESSQ